MTIICVTKLAIRDEYANCHLANHCVKENNDQIKFDCYYHGCIILECVTVTILHRDCCQMCQYQTQAVVATLYDLTDCGKLCHKVFFSLSNT